MQPKATETSTDLRLKQQRRLFVFSTVLAVIQSRPIELPSKSKLKKIRDRHEGPIQPVVSRKVKTGRNDPCPCGSGKKFKKCCLKGPS